VTKDLAEDRIGPVREGLARNGSRPWELSLGDLPEVVPDGTIIGPGSAEAAKRLAAYPGYRGARRDGRCAPFLRPGKTTRDAVHLAWLDLVGKRASEQPLFRASGITAIGSAISGWRCAPTGGACLRSASRGRIAKPSPGSILTATRPRLFRFCSRAISHQ